jgi:DNA-binding Xre family transcriptional regulator
MPSMHPLGQLIAQRMKRNDDSLSDAAAKAVRLGHNLTKNNLQRIQTTPVVSIKGDIIEAIAAALGVTPLMVANAALQSMGIEPHSVEVTDTLDTVAIDPTLSDRDRRTLTTLIAEMRTQSADDPKSVRPAALQDGEEWSVGWSTDEDPGVGRDEDRKQRNQL